MVVIYTQDKTYIRKDAQQAKDVLLDVYGEKLGLEAFAAIKSGREGTTYRKNGGPLVKVVSQAQGEAIAIKEKQINMM